MELKKLKALLGIPEGDMSQDIPLQFVINDVTETILNYCNINKLPSGLVNTAYRMAVDLYRQDRPGESVSPLQITSIKEGDTTTSFSSNLSDKGSLLKNYRMQLNSYRRLRK